VNPEERLEEALRAAGDDYLRRNPADLVRARTRVRQLRRRRQLRTGALGALATAAAVAVAVYAWPGAGVSDDAPRPAGRISPLPGSVSIDVGDVPAEVAVGHGAVWVANTGDSSVSRIDPAANEEVSEINLEGAPSDLAVGGDGEVWVALPELGVVQRIDPTTNALTPNMRIEVAVPGTPLDLAIDHYLWVSVVEEGLLQIDPVSGEVVNTITDLDPVNVAARGGAVFVLESDGAVRGIDARTGEPNAIELSFDVEGRGDVHYYDGHLWVAEGDGGDLFSVDVASGSQAISSYSFRGTYMEMVLVPEGVLVLSDLGDGTGLLSLVDLSGRGTVELAVLEESPRDLVRGLDDLWVSSSATGTVTRITGELPAGP
jgi:YVTN family beta-propeller protein